MMRIVQANETTEIQAASRLLLDYSRWLGFDLSFQGFDEELATFPGKYSPPTGALILAYVDEAPVGMVAMRKLTPETCEMKRLYVRPEGRGKGLGRALIAEVMSRARAAGYSRMRLDTVGGKMDEAIALYRQFGFCEIPPYYDSPVAHTMFFEADLH